MSYQATVVNVMLASPGDVAQERRIARDVIHEWNAVHSSDRGIVLMPVGWESHASPEMGDRAQAVINKQILGDCDLLLGLFWSRLGTPTGDAPSGSVEEIEEHLAAGKPVLLYFSSAPVRLDSVDADQYAALVEFKKSCMDRGLVEVYDDLTEFREKLSRQLAQTIIRQFVGAEPETAVRPPAAEEPPGSMLSDAARELLAEASQDSRGGILRIGTLGGLILQTNGRNFTEKGDRRSEAKWRSAVDELAALGLIEDRSGKGESFFVTGPGYDLADRLAGGATPA